jgi:hypothetical protein
MIRSLLLAIALLGSLNAWAYTVQVNKTPDFATAFQTLAVLPASCPPDFDCLWLENVIADKIRVRKVTVIPALVVRQRMFELEIKAITPENLKLLAEKLGVEAFVVAAVDSIATETSGATGVMVGTVFVAGAQKKSSGSVQMSIVSASTGKVLMEASGFGESSARPKKGVVGKAFNLILDRTFTPSFFAARSK